MASEDTPGTAGSEFHPETPQSAPQPETAERREVSVRRAPKYVPFLILGGLLGMAVAAAVAFGMEGNASYEPSAIFGFFLILFGAGGIILGAVAALMLDRLSVRRAEHAVVEAVPETGPENTAGTEPGTEPGTDPATDGQTDRKS